MLIERFDNKEKKYYKTLLIRDDEHKLVYGDVFNIAQNLGARVFKGASFKITSFDFKESIGWVVLCELEKEGSFNNE